MDFEINRDIRIPVYLQITEFITSKIREGIWQPHFKLPSEDELAKQLGVARGTVRQALNELATEGVLYRLHGKGTFVASDQIETKADGSKFLTFLEELVEKGVTFSTTVLEKTVQQAPKTVSSYLHLPDPENRVFKLRRLRSVGSSNIMLVDNHVVNHLCPGLDKFDFANTALYSVIEKEYGITIDWAMRLFKSVAAEGEIAELLAVPEGEPIMFVEHIVYDSLGRCIDVTNLWLRSDKVGLSMILKRK